ncbi:MAG: GGDEF domain-containing protein [Vulcanimicrobiota bacterium]
MAHDFIGRINKSQELRGGGEVNAPAAPIVRGDPALARLQGLGEPGAPRSVSDAAMFTTEMHRASETPETQMSQRSIWSSPQVTKALAVGGMLVGCAAGAFALGGAGFFLAMAAEALAFAGSMLMNNSAMAELEEENRRLREKATRDPLIGINNRSAIDEILHDQLLRAPFRQGSVSVIMADVDHFKSVNDTYGHQVGDEVLIEVAHRVSQGMRSQDSVGRYGGEEFLMVLPGISGTQAVLIAHRIRLLIAQDPFDTAAGDLSITMSLGVSCTDFPELQSPESLVKAADEALYRAKNEGRNRVVLSVLPQG